MTRMETLWTPYGKPSRKGRKVPLIARDCDNINLWARRLNKPQHPDTLGARRLLYTYGYRWGKRRHPLPRPQRCWKAAGTPLALFRPIGRLSDSKIFPWPRNARGIYWRVWLGTQLEPFWKTIGPQLVQ